jgi:hypothetical protein
VIGLLTDILCWIKQIGAMVLSALVDAVNLVLAALGALANGLMAAWPIDMPTLPAVPSQLATTMGWVKWTPLPITAAFGLFFFLLTVEILWFAGAAILRWAKVVD